MLVEESAIDRFGMDINEPVIQLKGQSINKIRLIFTDFISCGIMGNVSRFQYEILLDKELTQKSSQQFHAKTKSIKDRKALGLFGGRIVSINWAGYELAELLNHDSEILNTLLDCTKSLGDPAFQIQAKLPSTVKILGPKFTEPQCIMDLLSEESKERFEGCVFGYRICDVIAKHVRDLATTL